MSVDAAGALLSKIKEEADQDCKNEKELVDMNAGGEGSGSDCSINRELFF